MAKAKTAEKPPKIDRSAAPGAAAAAAPGTVPGAAPRPDERDAAIARLERTVAEERQNAATLREANDALAFKLSILEKSYAKQLTDARLRMDTAVKELASHKVQLAELGSGGEDTVRLLAEARAELNRIKADRNFLKEQLTRGGPRAGVIIGNGDDASDGSQTINALITSAGLKPPRERAGASDNNLGQRVRAEETSSIEMLSPDLIFTKSDNDDDEKPR
jgi:hypothetical protein